MSTATTNQPTTEAPIQRTSTPTTAPAPPAAFGTTTPGVSHSHTPRSFPAPIPAAPANGAQRADSVAPSEVSISSEHNPLAVARLNGNDGAPRPLGLQQGMPIQVNAQVRYEVGPAGMMMGGGRSGDVYEVAEQLARQQVCSYLSLG